MALGKRREGRLAAVQYLFAHDLHQQPAAEEISGFWELHSIKGRARKYAEELVNGVLEHLQVIDPLIQKRLENFSWERLAVVDRNILRVAAYELLHADDVPTPVILNEAIEVAKMLGERESAGFVNGILDRIAADRVSQSSVNVDPSV